MRPFYCLTRYGRGIRNFISNPDRSFLKILLLVIVFSIATPVLADYLGPNRTVTETSSACKVVLYECQFVASKGDWRYRRVEDWSCSNEGKPWRAYPNQPSSQGCFAATAGDQYWEREETVQQTTTTYPPATISGSLQNCTSSNGWCTTPPQLLLNGYEPVSGYQIIAIEGTLNGQSFACSGANCSIPLKEGNNSFNYWALSSWGDSSTMGSLATKVDTRPPSINGSFTGTMGSNNWYISPVNFNGNATDATSGLASFSCTLDGADLGSCNSISVNSDGPHTVVLTARDQAGHITTLGQNASIDTEDPLLNATLNGTSGLNSWYTAARLNASASDPSPGSGLAALEYNLDSNAWKTFPGTGVLDLPDGKHNLEVRAVDYAGRTVSSSKAFWLDSIPPALTISPSGNAGSNGWYISNLSIAGLASDTTSGIVTFEYQLNGGPWTVYTAPVILADGMHNLSVWAQDYAGHVTQSDQSYKVDTRPPQISGTLEGVPGAGGWYISEVTLAATAADPTPGSGVESFAYTINAGPRTAYTVPLRLSDGQFALELLARDNAGLVNTADQTIRVDTISPSLAIHTTFPAWINGTITITGDAGDSGSGLLKVEVTTDGGQTWQTTRGNTTWNYTWDSRNTANGIRDVQVRATDKAGLITRRKIVVGVDNRGPSISLPDSWYQWDSVRLDIRDEESGLSEARVEISDPEGRWPTRIIRLEPDSFPVNLKWDRRLGDNTIAPLGSYNVKVVALDAQDNLTTDTATINILLGMLPAGPMTTPQPVSRDESISTPPAARAEDPILVPTSTAVVSVFGMVNPPSSATEDSRAATPARAAPTQTTVVEWLESITAPVANAFLHVGEVIAKEPLPGLPASGSQSNVLWGAAAAGVIGAATTYALEEARKRKEEEEHQRARVRAEVEARNAAMDKMQQAKWEAQKVQNWLQGQAVLDAHIAEAKKNGASNAQITALKQMANTQGIGAALSSAASLTSALYVSTARKNQRTEEKEAALEEEMKSFDASPVEWEAAHREYMAKQTIENWRRAEQEVYEPPPGPTWWDNAKPFISKNIIQPINTYFFKPFLLPALQSRIDMISTVIMGTNKYVYQPYVKPELLETKQFLSDSFAWMNRTIYQPAIKPLQEKLSGAISAGLTWTNEHLVQPYLKPFIDRTVQSTKNEFAWINENLYRPYVKPFLETINEKIYKPYLKPVVDKTNSTITKWAHRIDESIYKPIIAPVVNDINKHIVQPIVKPFVKDAIAQGKAAWEKYGEWVHGALDLVGFIPGYGEIADLINGAIYLAEGRKLEAGLSALSIIPLAGDLLKSGKWTIKLGKQVVEEGVERLAKEVVEDVAERVAKETIDEVAEKLVKEGAEEGLEKAVKEGGEELIEHASAAVTKGAAIQELATNAARNFYEKWVHSALDLTGVIPGFGELTSGLNSLIYLGKGRYLDATLSAMSMVPVAGQLAQAGVSIVKIVKETMQGAAKQAGQELAEKALKEAAEVAAEKVAKEVGEDLSTKVVKESIEEGLQKATTEVAEEAASKVAKQTTEGITRAPNRELSETIIEKSVEESQDRSAPERARLVNTLNEKYGERMVGQFLPLCEKYGINPADVLVRPPAEGQTLIGWALGIDNPANPVNHPLVDLNLTEAQLDQIRASSIQNPDSNVVVLGYGQGAEKPYYELGKEIEASYLSLSKESWAPFENARANFFRDINSPFIADAIEERKIFLFNVDNDVIVDPVNADRFSLPELRQIELENNHYVNVSVGKYTAFVPVEKLTTYKQHLPANLFQ